jgi:hypothetical protein
VARYDPAVPAVDPDPFVLLATASEPAVADVCAALLRSADIEAHLRGESLGPYRLTIGDMATTQIWVRLSRLEEARALVFEGDVRGLEPPGARQPPNPSPPGARWSPQAVLLGALLLAAVLWLVLSRLF